MFISLLAITFVVALLVSLLISNLFLGSIRQILDRIIHDEIAAGWVRYLRFAIIVVGVSAGVRIHALERYILPEPRPEGAALPLPELNLNRWVLELYRTVIETAAGIAWLLLVFFVFALIAYVVVRIFEARRTVK